MSKKRKHPLKDIEGQFHALDRLAKGESTSKLSYELGIEEHIIQKWKLEMPTPLEYLATCNNIGNSKRYCLATSQKRSNFDVFHDSLWVWYIQQKRKGKKINKTLLKRKARYFNQRIDRSMGFTKNENWLANWQQHYGLDAFNISGEKVVADDCNGYKFTSDLKAVIKMEEFTPEQIYDFHETTLHFEMLPACKTEFMGPSTSSAGTSVSISQRKENIITVAICSNAAGTHKFPLFVVSKFSRTGPLFMYDWESVPIYFDYNPYSLMNAAHRTIWFSKVFVPAVEEHLISKNLPPKALLLLPKAPLHISSDVLKERNIMALYLPPSVMSSVQPDTENENIIMLLKKGYRKKLVSYIRENNYDKGVVLSLHNNMHKTISMLVHTWNEIPSSVLSNCWRNLFPDITNGNIQKEDLYDHMICILHQVNGYENLNIVDLKEWLNSDISVEYDMDDEDIIDYVKNETGEHTVRTCLSEPSIEIYNQKIKHSEVKDALDLAMRYIEQQESAITADVMCVKKWLDFALKNC